MKILSVVRVWLRNLARRDALERDMHEEFGAHIAMRADDLERRGIPRASAERAARIEFGSVEGYKDAARDAHGLSVRDELAANLAFAWRGVRHRPFQALVVVVTLTLGIGISAGVFATVDLLALRARVDGDPASFVRVFSAYGTDSTPPGFPAATSVSDYLAYRGATRSLRTIAGWAPVSASVEGRPESAVGVLVTCEYFDVYAPVHPLIGRPLVAADCDSRAPVAVVSEALWRDALSSSPDAIGRTVRVNGKPLRVVGVMPAFSSPTNDVDFWAPYTARGYLDLGTDDPNAPTALRVTIDGRLRPGFTRADARTELRVLSAAQDAVRAGRRTSVTVTDGSLLDKPGNATVILPIVALVFAALACLALVACANVVSLLLAVAHTRHVEMALRMALGSGTRRLARMLLTETMVLAVISGGLAIYVAERTPPLLLAWITNRALTFPTSPSWHVFLFLFATTLAAAAAVSIAPIRAAFRLDLVAALRGLTKDSTDNRGRSKKYLMAAQIGGSVALLVGAATLSRMPARVAAAPVHLDARHTLALNVLPPERATGAWAPYHADLDRTLKALPGVDRVAFGTAAPLNDERIGSVSVTLGPGGVKHALPWISVSPAYFETFGIRLERGRLLTTADDDCVAVVCPVVVSRETANELWPNDDPVGKRVTESATRALEVVGVVADAPSDLAARAERVVAYTAWAPGEKRYQAFARFTGDESIVTHRVAAAVKNDFPGAVAAPETIQRSLDRMTETFQRIGFIVGSVALIAATLALVGVFGAVSLSAKRRMKEMGIRMALGARDLDVYRAMVQSNVSSVFSGLLAGVAFAIGAAALVDRLTGAVLPVRLFDPFAFWTAPLAMGIVVFVAILLPARRATGASPVQALRQD